MNATLKLVNAYFWKTYYGPVFAIIFPILMLAILGNILRIEYVYPGIIALSAMFVGILSMPLLMSELKQSSLFKYIGTTALTPLKFMVVIIFYFFVVTIFSTTLILLMTMAFFSKKVFPHHSYNDGIFSGLGMPTGALSFIFSWLLHFGFSMALGIFMFSFINSGQHMAVIAFAIAIPSMFLSGMILSVDIIAKSEVMQWLSRFDPFRYTTGNLIVSATPKDQLGDLFHALSADDKKLIFKIKNQFSDVNQATYVFNEADKNISAINIQNLGTDSKLKTVFTISNASELKEFMNKYLPTDALKEQVIHDLTLYQLLFETKEQIVASSNNVFNFDSWGVRRMPDIGVLKEFVVTYLRGGGSGGDKGRFDKIWDSIQLGKFDWLDIFFKQNATLYNTGDKIVNLLVPISMVSLLIASAKRKFNWK